MCEIAPAPAGPGPVVVDIGGSVGAAVVIGPDRLAGHEIEVRPDGEAWSGRHVAFHRRHPAGEPVTAAVFPNLDEGGWQARLRHDPFAGIVSFQVVGGRVSRVAYPGRR